MSLTAGASATSPTLRIGFNADSQLNLAAGAILATQGDAAIAFNNAGTPTGSAATVSGPGSMWTITGDLAVGQHGKAGLTVANGAYHAGAGRFNAGGRARQRGHGRRGRRWRPRPLVFGKHERRRRPVRRAEPRR